jgi:hypothetical protein
MVERILLGSTLLFAVCGMAWLALAMDVHWRQLHGEMPLSRATAKRLRRSGALALLASLACCIAAEHPSMAALVWVMTTTASALIVTFTLAFRPRWLTFLAR